MVSAKQKKARNRFKKTAKKCSKQKKLSYKSCMKKQLKK